MVDLRRDYLFAILELNLDFSSLRVTTAALLKQRSLRVEESYSRATLRALRAIEAKLKFLDQCALREVVSPVRLVHIRIHRRVPHVPGSEDEGKSSSFHCAPLFFLGLWQVWIYPNGPPNIPQSA